MQNHHCRIARLAILFIFLLAPGFWLLSAETEVILRAEGLLSVGLGSERAFTGQIDTPSDIQRFSSWIQSLTWKDISQIPFSTGDTNERNVWVYDKIANRLVAKAGIKNNIAIIKVFSHWVKLAPGEYYAVILDDENKHRLSELDKALFLPLVK